MNLSFLLIVGGYLSLIWQTGWLGVVFIVCHVAIMLGAVQFSWHMKQDKSRYQPPKDEDY